MRRGRRAAPAAGRSGAVQGGAGPAWAAAMVRRGGRGAGAGRAGPAALGGFAVETHGAAALAAGLEAPPPAAGTGRRGWRTTLRVSCSQVSPSDPSRHGVGPGPGVLPGFWTKGWVRAGWEKAPIETRRWAGASESAEAELRVPALAWVSCSPG